MSRFYQYFSENMQALNLPAPEALFSQLGTAVATASAISHAVDKFGTRVTVRELIAAGTRLEKLNVVGALSAAYYAGAVVGSIAVASGRMLGNGTSLSDVMFALHVNRLRRPWLVRKISAERHHFIGRNTAQMR